MASRHCCAYPAPWAEGAKPGQQMTSKGKAVAKLYRDILSDPQGPNFSPKQWCQPDYCALVVAKVLRKLAWHCLQQPIYRFARAFAFAGKPVAPGQNALA